MSYYPPEVDQILARCCSLRGIVFMKGEIKVFACQPTDEALACLMLDDPEGAEAAGLVGGRNVWVIQWYGKGATGIREALFYLAGFVGEGGVLAGRRGDKIKTWSKEWLDNRRKQWAIQ
ncbi:MAG TPA: hypothetical protein PLA03_12135 [Acidobacteriota bacterium]|nr:hypothetical protein [Acidobacteriota bacterium]